MTRAPAKDLPQRQLRVYAGYTMPAAANPRRSVLSSIALAPWIGAVAPLPGVAQAPPVGSLPDKVLRVAFSAAETGFDPARYGDLFSGTIIAHVFEPLFTYDPLAVPVKLIPLTAAGPAESSDDHRTWTIHIRPGIFFADDPAFGGRKRELVAEDYVFAFKRYADPVVRTNNSLMADLGLRGFARLARQAVEAKRLVPPRRHRRPDASDLTGGAGGRRDAPRLAGPV